MFTLKELKLFDYLGKEELYSKLIRGGFLFDIETHSLNQNTHLQIKLFRPHSSIEKVEKGYGVVDIITKQESEYHIPKTIIRLCINDKEFMIDTGEECVLTIKEYNVNKEFPDFKKGKAIIILDFFFKKEVDTSKVRKELKNISPREEENNEISNTCSMGT